MTIQMTPSLYVFCAPAIACLSAVSTPQQQPPSQFQAQGYTLSVSVRYLDETDQGAAGPSEINDFLEELQAEFGADQFDEARKWVGATFYNDDVPTLAGLRLRLGLTQGQLASKLGLHQSAIARLESGRQDPRLSSSEALAAALNVDLTVLATALKATRASGTKDV